MFMNKRTCMCGLFWLVHSNIGARSTVLGGSVPLGSTYVLHTGGHQHVSTCMYFYIFSCKVFVQWGFFFEILELRSFFSGWEQTCTLNISLSVGPLR